MHDLIIIGGGVSAFSAAIYSSRRGLKTLVLAKDLGGQANFTDLIENYPGIEETGGFELVSSIKEQAEKFGAATEIAEVSKIKQVADGSFVLTAYGKQYKTKTIILAHGKTPRDLGVPGEEEFKGKGVSYCATCDAPLFKNKIVAVAGIGDLSLDTALLAAKFAKKVYVLSKTDKLIGHPALQKALSKKQNVEMIPFIQIQEITGQDKLVGLKLLDLRQGGIKTLPIDGLFVELGYVVKSDFVAGLVQLDEQGQVVINPDQSTSHPGIFAAGDATNRPYKQAVISAGEGASAALAVYDYIAKLSGGHGLTSDWTQIKRIK
jgi:thioredoxin reductase (NADPH)